MAVKRKGTGLIDFVTDKKSIASKTVKAVDMLDNAAWDAETGAGSRSSAAERGRTAERAISKYNRARFEDQSRVNPDYKWR